MISNVSLKDLDEFNRLGLLVNDNFKGLFSLEDLLKSEYDYIFGYYEDKLVGFIHVNKLYESMDIINIVVSPNYRNKGIGTELINYSINYFDDLKTVMLEVRESNKDAIDLYLKNDFVVINKRDKYYGNDSALIMKRDV